MACGGDVCGFIGHVYHGRWFMLFASFMIMAAAGATYIFGVYSKDIKSILGYNQQTLNTLGFFKDLGANFGIISGLINEIAPEWVVLAMGAVMNFFGYFMIYLVIMGRLHNPKVWHMCLYIAIGANSQGFTNTGAMVPCVKNFPESRGLVLGLLKGFVGLSGAIFTQLYHAIYGEDSKSVVLLIAWLPAVIAIASVHCVRVIDKPHQSLAKEFKIFCQFLYISIVLCIYILVIIVVQNTLSFARKAYIVSSVVILLGLISPLYVVVREEHYLWIQKKLAALNPPPVTITIDKKPSPETKITATPAKKSDVSCFANIFNPPKRGEDYTILQALVSIDMIMVFVSTVIGTGGTLTAIDNMGQIGESLGYDRKSVGTFVSLISIWNYVGRVTAGFASEMLIHKYKVPRPLMFAVVLLVSCIGFLLISFPCTGAIYVSTVILGVTFGAQMPLFLAIISELFGLKHYSTLFNVGVLSSPVGSYFFNVLIAGRLYDREAEKQRAKMVAPHGKELTCMGVECYRNSFIIISALTFVAGVIQLILTCRTRQFYGSDIYARYRVAEEDGGGKAAVSGGDGEGSGKAAVSGGEGEGGGKAAVGGGDGEGGERKEEES